MFRGSSTEEKTPLLLGNEVERETHITLPTPRVENENVDKPAPIDKNNNNNNNNDNNNNLNPSNYVFPLRRQAQRASPKSMRGRSRSRGPNRRKSFVFLSDNDTDDIVRTDEQGNLLFALPNSRKMSISFDQENTDGDSIQLFSSQEDGKESKLGPSKRKRGNLRKSREKLTRSTPMVKIAEDEHEESSNKLTKDIKKKEPQRIIEDEELNATLPIFPVLKPNFNPSMRLKPERSRNIPLMGSIDEEEEEVEHHEKPEKKQVSYRFPIQTENSPTNQRPTFNEPEITEESEEENKSKGGITMESTIASSRHLPRLHIYGGHPSLHACAVRRKPLTEPKDSSPDKEKEKTQTSTPTSFTNQISLSGQVELGIKCLVARTALILPFSFGNHQLPSSYWIQHLINRHITDEKGTRIQLWEQKDILPQEVAELSRQFRQMVGWQDREGRFTINTWRCRRLVLTKNARDLLFKNARLWAVQREGIIEKDITREVHVSFIELLLFPLGLGILMYKINWLPKNKPSRRNSLVNGIKGVVGANKRSDDSSGGEESTPTRSRANLLGSSSILEENMANSKDPFLLEELRTWLYVAKFRHTVPHVVKGWTFEGRGRKSKTLSEGETEAENILPEHSVSLGKRMSRALYEGKPISLNAVGNWLLLFDDEDPFSPPARLGYGGHAYHHSTVVIDREPSPLTLQEYLFHLRRAFGQKNRPPYLFNQLFRNNLNSSKEAMGNNFEPFGGLDQILIPRLNRHIGISREGIVCITWSTDTNAKPMNFDVSKWHKKFQGIYLILSLHTFGERAVLEELSTLAAFQADNMKLEVGTGLGRGIDMDSIQKSRNEMKELATLVARFTISMSSDDCGGPSEYSEFFTTLRRIFGIPTKRAELREELQDTLALLESSYLEERRRLKVEEQREEKSERERIRKVRLMKEAHKHKYDTMFSAISSLTIPAVLLSSIFGMNIQELPNINFWHMIILIGVISLIALVVQLICFRGIEKYEPLEGTLVVNEHEPKKRDWFKNLLRKKNKQEQQQQQEDAV